MAFHTEINFETWKKHRSFYLIYHCFASFGYGFTQSVFFQTEYFYFRDTIKANPAKLFYGLALAVLSCSQALTGLAISYYADKTRNVRQIAMVSHGIAIVGNILYTMYYSPYIVILGNLLVGSIGAIQVTLESELSRVYSPDKLSSRLSLVIFCALVGCISAPCMIYLVDEVDVQVEHWKIVVGNIPAIYLVFFNFICVLFLIFVKNVSREYGNLAPEEQKENFARNKQIKQSFTEYLKDIFCLLRFKLAVLLLVLSFAGNYIRGVLRTGPVLYNELLHWTEIDLSTLNITSTLISLVVSIPILKIFATNKYNVAIISLTIMLLTSSLACILSMRLVSNHSQLAASAFLATGFITTGTISLHAVVKSLLGQIVPENLRGISYALRLTIQELSYGVAGLLVTVNLDYTVPLFSVYISCNLLLLVLVLLNRSGYSNIETIDLDEKEDLIEG